VKTLILVRHAKSSWNSDAGTDFERPLNNRGSRDAPEMAARLVARRLLPDTIISSAATRALVTSRLLLAGLALNSRILQTTDRIYEAPVPTLLETISDLQDSYQTAMIVGHNPGMSATTNHLCSEASIQMPTCAMACLDLDIDCWADVYRDCAALRWYDYPKNQSKPNGTS